MEKRTNASNVYCIQGNVIGRKDCNGPRGGGGTMTSPSLSTSSTSTPSHTLAFNTTQITSRYNGSRPQWDDPCHCLASTDHPPAVVIAYE